MLYSSQVFLVSNFIHLY